jgi:hypothetical protein
MELMTSDHPRWEEFANGSLRNCPLKVVTQARWKTNRQLSFKDDSEAFSYSLLILDEMGFDSRWSAQYFH